MELSALRDQIDKIDSELVTLFKSRMELSSQIAEYKKRNSMPIFIPSREREVLEKVCKEAGADMSNYISVLYAMLFELSRIYQGKCNQRTTPLYQDIIKAIENTQKLFPQSPVVACQGLEGAHVQIACERIFKKPTIAYFKNYESVFQAIEQGFCEYGILPIENSTAGSVKKIYDLLIANGYSIVRTIRLKIDHNLLANPGAKLCDIKEIYSHERAINQCSDFLKNFPEAKIIAVENTAVAASMVAKSGRTDVAALSSHACESIYNLVSLANSIQGKDTNRTKFICISKNLEIYPGADKTSIMMILPHKPGALYKVLARLYTLGINIGKLESRTIPDDEYAFMFYFDLETSIYSEEFVQLMCELDDLCKDFKYLGSYSEVV